MRATHATRAGGGSSHLDGFARHGAHQEGQVAAHERVLCVGSSGQALIVKALHEADGAVASVGVGGAASLPTPTVAA